MYLCIPKKSVIFYGIVLILIDSVKYKRFFDSNIKICIMIIGRTEELKLLRDIVESEYSEFVAIYGRRRVGKTFLVREAFNYSFTFQHAGIAKQSIRKQLEAWKFSLKDAGLQVKATPKNWFEAFDLLKDVVRATDSNTRNAEFSDKSNKKVIFIDEMPWMDTPRSGFVSALEAFWNGWASGRKDILLIICGSATSWIINKIIKNHGGLHNRVTHKIPVRPFFLNECELMSESRNLGMSKKQIMEAYMVFGGVPFYWTLLKKDLSLTQNIDRLFFGPNAELKGEFGELYASLFREPEIYLKVVYTLGKKRVGMTREELIDVADLDDSGQLSRVLEDLEYCGFIRKYNLLDRKSKGAVFQLVDFYTLFYFKMIEGHEQESQFWSRCLGSRQHDVWCGLAFERVCLWHVEQIKRAMSIGGIVSREAAWYTPRKKGESVRGAQIDLIIDRNDDTINVCEMKYYSDEVVLNQEEEDKIQNRVNRLKTESGTIKAVRPVLVTTKGLKRNCHSEQIQAVVVLEDLFR